MQPEEIVAIRDALNFPTLNATIYRSKLEESLESAKKAVINETTTQSVDVLDEDIDGRLYMYGTPPLILFCIISIAINIKVLMSIFWIRRPLSPTLHISLSLAGADAFSSTALGIGLIMNSFIPNGLKITLTGVDCFLLALETVRLGSVIITVFHLMALAINHYLGILRPLHYLSIMTYRNITILLILLWILPISFFALYFNLIEDDGFQSEECKKNTFLIHRQFRMLFSSLFFGPFALMVCIYVHIFYIVKRHQATRLRFRRAGSTIRGRPIEMLRNNTKQMAQNVKAVQTTLYILGSFVIGWMPAVMIYVLVCEDCIFQFNWMSARAKFFIYTMINGLIILKSLVNPIIYAARMHEIKVATKRMHHAFCHWITITRFAPNRRISRTYSEESRHSHSRNGTCRLSYNMNMKKTRNGNMYTCTGYNTHEYGNTFV